MPKTKVTRRCVYCMCESDVINYSVRNIPGYQNAFDGSDKAVVEKLACGHEYVDGKFNASNLYHYNPERVAPRTAVSHVATVNMRSHSINVMDIGVGLCALMFAFTVWPLLILPALYFFTRD